MNIRTIEDNNTNFNLVVLKSTNINVKATPHCLVHGAMNKVSKFENGGLWRCHNKKCRAGCEEFK